MPDSIRLAIEAARAAEDQKARDVRILDMRNTLGITDFFVLSSGTSDRQVRRIQEGVEERLKEEGARPVRREGERYAGWIVLDYIDFVVHIFLDEVRSFYDLEHLWKNAPLVSWEEGV